MFLCNSLAFSIIQQILTVWSLVPLSFLNPAWTYGSSRFTYYWNLGWRILSITLLACEKNAIVCLLQHSLALPFFGIGMKTDLFQSVGALDHLWIPPAATPPTSTLSSECRKVPLPSMFCPRTPAPAVSSSRIFPQIVSGSHVTLSKTAAPPSFTLRAHITAQ